MWLIYNEHYLVSDDGLIKSIRYGRERILKPFRVGNYLGVWLGAGNKKYVHHLVAELFCPRIDLENLEIDHINRNKHDNSARNLRWICHTDNMKNLNDYTRKGYSAVRFGKEILVKDHRVKCRMN